MVRAPLRYPLTDWHLQILDVLGSDLADRHRPWPTPVLRRFFGLRDSDSRLTDRLRHLCTFGLVEQSPGRVHSGKVSGIAWTWSLTPLGLAVYKGALADGHDPRLAPRSFVVSLP